MVAKKSLQPSASSRCLKTALTASMAGVTRTVGQVVSSKGKRVKMEAGWQALDTLSSSIW